MDFRKLTIVAASAALLSLSAARAFAQNAEDHGAPAQAKGTADVLITEGQRKKAPDFTLADATGHPLTLSSYRGKVVLLDFWATWCGGCKVEIPWYVEFDHKYRDKGLAVIGVSMDDQGFAIVKPFLAQKGIDYPVVIGNDELAKHYSLGSMPMTLLMDREGRIALSHTGVVDKNNFESHIQELLK